MSRTIDVALKKAKKLVEFQDYATAKNILNEAINKHPNNPRLKALSDSVASKIDRPIAPTIKIPSQEIIRELSSLCDESEWTTLITRCFEILSINEDMPLVWNFLGLAQRANGMPRLAEVSHKHAVALDPNFYGAYTNLGNVLKDLKKYEESIAYQKKAIALSPTDYKPLNNLGTLYEDIGMFDDASESFEQALKIDPGNATAEYNLGSVSLRHKDFKNGWRQRERRWERDSSEQEAPLETSKPAWDGSQAGRLFVWAEQGVGDEIMFGSCFEDLLSRCDELIVSTSERILPLFERSFTDRATFVSRFSPLPEDLYDVQSPMLSALGFLRQDQSDFKPAAKPYLVADEKKIEILRGALEGPSGGKPIVGLSWFSQNKTYGKRRSLTLEQIAERIPKDCFLVNLQYGDVNDEISQVAKKLGRNIANFGNVDNWMHLDSLAALITVCDKVVSIDNSTAHFAGALGKESHILLPYSADWRWGTSEGTSSYWYSSTNLYWQSELDNWNGPLLSLEETLMTKKNSPG